MAVYVKGISVTQQLIQNLDKRPVKDVYCSFKAIVNMWCVVHMWAPCTVNGVTHVGHVRLFIFVWPLWFWHLIGAKFDVAMFVHVICSCAFVTCAHRPPNRYETSLPYIIQCAVWNSRSDKIAKIYNQDSLQSAHTCNHTQASPADVTGVVNLRGRFASVVTGSRFVTRTSRDLPLCAS